MRIFGRDSNQGCSQKNINAKGIRQTHRQTDAQILAQILAIAWIWAFS